MASSQVFQYHKTKFGKVEFQASFGRNKTITFKKSARGGFYFLDLANHQGNRLNLGLDELDELFALRGQLERLTGYFEKSHTPRMEQLQSSEPPTLQMQSLPPRLEPQTCLEQSPTLTFMTLNDVPLTPPPSPTRGQPIPVATTKRPSTTTHNFSIVPVKKHKSEALYPEELSVSPLYQFSAEELTNLFQPM